MAHIICKHHKFFSYTNHKTKCLQFSSHIFLSTKITKWPEGPGFESRSPRIAQTRVRLAWHTFPDPAQSGSSLHWVRPFKITKWRSQGCKGHIQSNLKNKTKLWGMKHVGFSIRSVPPFHVWLKAMKFCGSLWNWTNFTSSGRYCRKFRGKKGYNGKRRTWFLHESDWFRTSAQSFEKLLMLILHLLQLKKLCMLRL